MQAHKSSAAPAISAVPQMRATARAANAGTQKQCSTLYLMYTHQIMCTHQIAQFTLACFLLALALATRAVARICGTAEIATNGSPCSARVHPSSWQECPLWPLYVCVCRHVCMYITLLYTTLHYTSLHYTSLHYTTLHYIALYYLAGHYITLHYTTLHYTILHITTLHFTTLHFTTLHACMDGGGGQDTRVPKRIHKILELCLVSHCVSLSSQFPSSCSAPHFPCHALPLSSPCF